ncbi:MAG: EAL and GGDEF domain-containing protein [Desulfobacterales bacterium]|nr:EAL and GGDEF domain-containing protein [Desulfobacterales bacterium]
MEKDMLDIISKERITTVFQPIIDLKTANIYAVEALSRIVGNSPFKGPDQLFMAAQRYHLTYPLEKLCRKQALLTAHRLDINCPITLNVCPSVLKSKDHVKGETLLLIEELFEVKNQVILELTEQFYIHDHKLFSNTVNYYREQGFRIAIDDLGSGFAGLNMLMHLEPFMVKVDRSIISDIHKTPKKRILLESLISFCHKFNALVVAEGIERQEELDMLISMKVDLGQGYFLAKPEPLLHDCPKNVQDHIQMQNRENHLSYLCIDVCNCIESLVRPEKPIELANRISEAAERFKDDPLLTCLPVLHNNIPLGIVHKDRLFYKLGQRFGYDLYNRKSVENILEPALIFESGTSLDDVARKVLSRKEETIYDSIIVTYNCIYLGMVKIHQILERITDQKIYLARQANPLTGLPGNNVIKEEIMNRLNTNQLFSVLYFDLDNFKPFNDNFGFDQGDHVLRLLATILKDTLFEWDMRSFLGHIGGDDFVGICGANNISQLCERILERFDHEIRLFHDDKTIALGYYESRDRLGEMQRFPLLSLSIAVVSTSEKKFSSYGHLVSVASEIKKKAKSLIGSSFYIDRRTE